MFYVDIFLELDDCEQGGPLYFCLGGCANKLCFCGCLGEILVLVQALVDVSSGTWFCATFKTLYKSGYC